MYIFELFVCVRVSNEHLYWWLHSLFLSKQSLRFNLFQLNNRMLYCSMLLEFWTNVKKVCVKVFLTIEIRKCSGYYYMKSKYGKLKMRCMSLDECALYNIAYDGHWDVESMFVFVCSFCVYTFIIHDGSTHTHMWTQCSDINIELHVRPKLNRFCRLISQDSLLFSNETVISKFSVCKKYSRKIFMELIHSSCSIARLLSCFFKPFEWNASCSNIFHCCFIMGIKSFSTVENDTHTVVIRIRFLRHLSVWCGTHTMKMKGATTKKLD